MKKTNLTPNNSTVIHDQHTICGLICELNRNDQSGVLLLSATCNPSPAPPFTSADNNQNKCSVVCSGTRCGWGERVLLFDLRH